MSNQQTPEMRLVHTDDGWATAIERRISVPNFIAAMVLVFAGIFGGIGMAEATGIEVLAILAVFASLPAILVFPMTRFTRFRLHRGGIQVADLPVRTNSPSLEVVRSGEPALPGLDLQGTNAHDLDFSQIRAMGYTDYSVWFDMPDTRVEIPLERTRREDIARLHDTIHDSWTRFQQGLAQTEDDAQRQRQRLASLQPQ